MKRFYDDNNTEFCYGRIWSDEEMQKVFDKRMDFITDLQNLSPEREELIKSNNYELKREGYELTGLCDLYQFYFVKK